jgi:hypothetical protein
MSLRSHLNWLGVASWAPLGIERYLLETYELVLGIIFRAAIGLVLLAAAAAASSVAYLAVRKFRTLASVRARSRRFTRSTRALVAPLLLALLFALYFWTLTRISNGGLVETGIAVGDLAGKPSVRKTEAGDTCVILLVACAASAAIVRFRTWFNDETAESVAHRWLWRSIVLLTTLVALHIPIIYGREVRATTYPTAQVVTERQTGCGLLVLATSSEIYLWHITSRTGNVWVIPRSRIMTFTTGNDEDLLNVIRAMQQGKPLSLCPAP